MSLTLRQAVIEDSTVLGQPNATIQALHVEARPDIFVPVAPSAVAEWLRAMLRRADCRAWLAELDGVAAGYALALIHDRPATPFSGPRRWCEIDQLGVAEGMRGRGVARALIEAALAWARNRGVAEAQAQCWAFNTAAHEAFAHLGFVPMTVRFERRP